MSSVYDRKEHEMNVLTITDGNYEQEVIISPKPVIIDLWAAWCSPCKMIAPVLEEIAEEYADFVKVGKINIDEQPELRDMFEVMSIPMIVLMKGGVVDKKIIGAVPKEQIVETFGLKK